MKYFTFFRESNNFDDILKDPTIKKVIDEQIKWYQHLMIGIQEGERNTFSYITLKFGDEMVSDIVKDQSPVPGVDYQPKKDPSKFIKEDRSEE